MLHDVRYSPKGLSTAAADSPALARAPVSGEDLRIRGCVIVCSARQNKVSGKENSVTLRIQSKRRACFYAGRKTKYGNERRRKEDGLDPGGFSVIKMEGEGGPLGPPEKRPA